MKTTESIPEWAICYCVNGDSTGLSNEEISMIDKWMQDWQVDIVSPIADEEGNYHPYFTHYPLFGLATDVIDCDIIYHNDNPTTPLAMTRMTENGISTTQRGQEQYETFYSAHRGKKVSRVMYDYRDTDNELFSCVAPTLAECRSRRDKWLKEKEGGSK